MMSDLLPLDVPAAPPPPILLRAPHLSPTRWAVVPSPIGELLLAGDGDALTGLWMLPDPRWAPDTSGWLHDTTAFDEVSRQLDAYFAGELHRFDLALAPAGTPFQLRVWQALLEIPYGATCTYGALASRLGRPDRARAVGAANGRNPISIVIPCHRVIGTGGDLVGYGGGLPRKAALLALERSGRLPALASPLPA